jgi:putative aldouronate transport system permease protein
MVLLLILNMGGVLGAGFDKIFLMQNNLNLPVSEVISTYVYKIGLLGSQFSYSTAIGLFNTVINFAFLFITNQISKKVANQSLW